MSFGRITKAVGLVPVLALSALLPACGSAEGFTPEDEAFMASEEQFETRSEALFYEKDGACANYEAENMVHNGGRSTSGGWRLSNWGENITQNDHPFSSGEHTITIIAWGSKGWGSLQPDIRLSLNNYPIADVRITNTSYTDGWREYAVTYDVQTGNAKDIKIELVNPGQGRSVRIDGVSVYCPQDGVICDGEPGCDHCYTTGGEGQECRESSFEASGKLDCDQQSDCGGDLCAFTGSFFDGFQVDCMLQTTCEENEASGPFVCRDICKSPGYPETECSGGRVCADVDLNPEFQYEYSLPGWKFCVEQ